MRNAVRAVCATYAGALLMAGAGGLWRAPLTYDEARYYQLAIRFFAARLPRIPLDYPAPSPPFAFVLQSLVYRLSGDSVTYVRVLSTLAAIGCVVIIAHILGNHPRAAVVALMVGTFPPMLTYAFSLKQHWMAMLFITAGFALWRSGRDRASAAALLCGVLTNQIVAAFVIAIIVRQAVTRRRVLPYLIPLAALAALVFWWHGLQPPMYVIAPTVAQPALLHLYWPQLLLLLFAAGVWIVPMLSEHWRPVAAALVLTPLAFIALQRSRMMIVHPDPDPAFYERATGPMLGLIRAVAGTGLLSVVIASIGIAIGCAIFAMKRDDDVAHAQTYAVAYALVMLPVPFFFESYFALFVAGSWLILARRMSESRSRTVLAANIAAIVLGIGHAVVRFRMPS